MNSFDDDKLTQEVDFVLPLKDVAENFVSADETLFSEESFFSLMRKKIFVWLCEIFEKVLGVELFVKSFGDEFDFVDSKIKKLMYDLFEKGILEDFRFLTPKSVWPRIIYANTSLKPVRMPSGNLKKLGGTVGGACALGYNAAARQALAEVLERYSLSFCDPKRFVTGTFDELKRKNAVDPLKFKCFSERQLENAFTRKKHYFNHDSLFSWIEARSLFDSQKYLVPAQMVFMFYERLEGEPIIRETSTNGAAAGSSWEMASYNAICEAIERDALMIFWLNKLTPPKIDISELIQKNPVIENIYNQFQRLNLELSILDITTDIGVPTVMSIVLDDSGQRRPLHIGLRTDLNVRKAVIGSMFEFLGMGVMKLPSVSEMERVNKLAPNALDLKERKIFWADSGKLKHIEFLLEGKTKRGIKDDFANSSYRQKLEELKRIFRKKRFDVYLVDATSQAARDAGLVVSAALIPGIYPLYLNENFKYLGVGRLYTAPVEMGHLKSPKTEDEMNPVPHPMP